MVVKEKRGRRRYVAFALSSDMGKQDLISVLRGHGAAPYVVQCAGGHAVIRCGPEEVAAVKDLMRDADPGSVPLSTSGTLKALRARIPALAAGAGKG